MTNTERAGILKRGFMKACASLHAARLRIWELESEARYTKAEARDRIRDLEAENAVLRESERRALRGDDAPPKARAAWPASGSRFRVDVLEPDEFDGQWFVALFELGSDTGPIVQFCFPTEAQAFEALADWNLGDGSHVTPKKVDVIPDYTERGLRIYGRFADAKGREITLKRMAVEGSYLADLRTLDNQVFRDPILDVASAKALRNALGVFIAEAGK